MSRLRGVARWIPAAIWAGGIFYASAQRGEDLPNLHFTWADKVLHFGGYAILAALLLLPLRTPRLAVVVAVLYGISDEIHQSMVPHRFVSGLDLLADLGGALLGAYVTHAFLVRMRRRAVQAPLAADEPSP